MVEHKRVIVLSSQTVVDSHKEYSLIHINQ